MVEGIARQVLQGRFEDIVGTAAADSTYGFEDPLMTIEIGVKGGRVYSMKVGNQVPKEGEVQPGQVYSRYIKIGSSPFIGTMSEYAIRGLQQKPDQLQDPTTKEPTVEATPGVPEGPVIVPPEGTGR
jgi:hypothetical protein